MSFTFSDWCCGIGGIRIALEEVGGKCVYSSEINQAAVKTYKDNFYETPEGDLTLINKNSIPKHDILCAGFPCQPFSKAGLNGGFNDPRGTIFFHLLEIIRLSQPSVVFLENVKGLVSHDNGNTLKVIIEELEKLQYFVSYRVLNSVNFGVPQSRERIYIVASKIKLFDFDKLTLNRSVPLKEYITKDNRIYLDPKTYTIIPTQLHKKTKNGLIFCGYLNKTPRKSKTNRSVNSSAVHRQQNRIYSIDGYSPTLCSGLGDRMFFYDGFGVFKIDVTTAYALQGFSKNFKINNKKTTSLFQIGNSVTINVISSIVSEIKNQGLL